MIFFWYIKDMTDIQKMLEMESFTINRKSSSIGKRII